MSRRIVHCELNCKNRKINTLHDSCIGMKMQYYHSKHSKPIPLATIDRRLSITIYLIIYGDFQIMFLNLDQLQESSAVEKTNCRVSAFKATHSRCAQRIMRNDFDELCVIAAWHNNTSEWNEWVIQWAIDRHTTQTHKIIIHSITSQITLFSVSLSLTTGYFFLLDDVPNRLSPNEVHRRLNNGPRNEMFLGAFADFFSKFGFSVPFMELEAVLECWRWRLFAFSTSLSIL